MANTDYIKKGAGNFASVLALDAPLGRFADTIPYTRFRFARDNFLRPGLVVMVNDEIMRLEAVGDLYIVVKRGCADTIPAEHAVDDLVWLFDTGTVGGDRVERSATEVVAVKVSPFTIGGGGVPVGSIVPVEVEFNWRFFRPYPPARLKANEDRWTVLADVDADTPMLHLTWAHRDRVIQADQLIGHDDDSVGPEPGVTYTLSVIHPVSGQVVRTETGIRGTEFMYRRVQATHDMGHPTEVLIPVYHFRAMRDGFESWQHYEGRFSLYPVLVPESVPFLPFDSRVIEAPYAVNVAYDVPQPAGNYALAMGARPADRMADYYQLFWNGQAADTGFPASKAFTPWVTLEYRLPELETTINIRSTSLFDGVSLAGVQVGHMGLIDDEIVQVERVTATQVIVKRGCVDTVPAVHLPGARCWFFQASAAFDKIERTDGESLAYQLLPVAYSEPHNLAAQPAYGITFTRRAERPYAPGRIVVNGRPWFEEAQATSGAGVAFSWARRNRVAQGSGVVAHSDPDQTPEPGQMVRLLFYYETPAPGPDQPPAQHYLRHIDTGVTTTGPNANSGLAYTYSYAAAQADGLAAGQALGICGTVVIYCRISAIRDDLESLQSYVVPIRVPSFPC